MTFDGKAFGQEIVEAVKSHMAGALSPIIAKMDALEKRIAELPEPPKDIGVKADEVRQMIEDAISAIPPAEPGKSADPEETAALVRGEVEKAIAAIDKPRDGKSVTVEELAPLVDATVSRAVAAIPRPKDGLDAVEFLRGPEGNLIVTMSNGMVRDLGKFVGKDGIDCDMSAVERSIADKVAAIPKPQDGLGFDDLDMVETEKGVFLQFKRGDVVKDFRLPVVLDRGVYKEGVTYQKGDGATWAGSFWIAQEETSEKPDTGKGWRLAVKRGRDGRDGVVKEQKPVKVKV